jgi:hypothetical protein
MTINIKPSYKGNLHKELGVPLEQNIPAPKLAKAERSASPAERKQAAIANNEQGWKHSGNRAGKTRRRTGA